MFYNSSLLLVTKQVLSNYQNCPVPLSAFRVPSPHTYSHNKPTVTIPMTSSLYTSMRDNTFVLPLTKKGEGSLCVIRQYIRLSSREHVFLLCLVIHT